MKGRSGGVKFTVDQKSVCSAQYFILFPKFMIHQPPAGARDLLPLEVAQKSWINNHLEQVFQRHGYRRIVTSTLEWLETLVAGGAIEPSTVLQVQNTPEGVLGLRPELTASIARAAITRMAGDTFPQRLCYRANVFRNAQPGYHGRQLEFYQAGVELLCAGGILADTEIILLLNEALTTVGIKDWHLLLGEAGLTRSLLAVFPESLREKIRYCIAQLDYVALESLDLSGELKQRALALFDLRGNPYDVLKKVSQLSLDETAQQSVHSLTKLIELLSQSSTKPLPIILDLSLIQSFDYYTGIVFEAISYHEEQACILGQGGRYDRLLSYYDPHHHDYPGIGFSLNIEALHTCLLDSPSLPYEGYRSDWLVIPTCEEAQGKAFRYAQELRSAPHLVKVEIDLGGRNAEELRHYARNHQISYLAWVSAEGVESIECL